MAGLSSAFMRPIAQNIGMYPPIRGMTRAPGLYSGWSISAGGGGGAAVGNMNTPTWGYGQGGEHGSSGYSNKAYIRNGVAASSGGPTAVNLGGTYGDGTGGYSAHGKPVGSTGGAHGEYGWHDPSIRNPRGSMPTTYSFGGNRNGEVLPAGLSTSYGRAGMGGSPPSSTEPAVNGQNSASGYNSGYKRVLYG